MTDTIKISRELLERILSNDEKISGRAYQQSMLHDPKGLRPKPQTSLFKL